MERPAIRTIGVADSAIPQKIDTKFKNTSTYEHSCSLLVNSHPLLYETSFFAYLGDDVIGKAIN